MHHLLDLCRLFAATAILALYPGAYEDPSERVGPPVDLTQVALIVFAAVTMAANIFGVWWLVAELAGR